MIHKAELFEGIYSFIERMKEEMAEDIYRKCKFNGIEFEVHKKSYVEDIIEIFFLSRELKKYEKGN